MRFLLDDNLAARLAALLSDKGHEALTVVGIGLARAPDPVVLLAAAERGAALITENHQDLLLLHWAWRLWAEAWPANWRPEHAGILTVVPRASRDIEQTADAIGRLARSGRRLSNELYRWRGSGDWEHYAPLESRQ